jgi:hypothetical protein
MSAAPAMNGKKNRLRRSCSCIHQSENDISTNRRVIGRQEQPRVLRRWLKSGFDPI